MTSTNDRKSVCDALRQNAETRQDVHGLVAAKPDLLRLAASRIDLLTLTLRQIADPSYVGNYDPETVIDIYRSWAKLALEGMNIPLTIHS